MSIADQPATRDLPAPPWGCLPARIRCLFVAGAQRMGGWLADALATDSATEVELVEVPGTAAGLAHLRDEAFEAVLISHEPPQLDALEFLDAIRAGGIENPALVVLGQESEPEMSAHCYESGADAYICLHTATTRALIWTVARGIQFRRLLGENGRLEKAERHRLERDQQEAARLLNQQRAMIYGDDDRDDGRTGPRLPARLVAHYRELLRTYVIMGTGNLAAEVQTLGDLLVAARVTARDAMGLHLSVLEEMVQGLGKRSARHVMNRADMITLEMMIHLANGYRQRWLECVRPARQTLLPGFADVRVGHPLPAGSEAPSASPTIPGSRRS